MIPVGILEGGFFTFPINILPVLDVGSPSTTLVIGISNLACCGGLVVLLPSIKRHLSLESLNKLSVSY